MNWMQDRATCSLCSPPPCGEGLGVGVSDCGTAVAKRITPLPSPPPPELGFTRVRHLKRPKSDKSDFGWGREHTESAARSVSISLVHLLASLFVVRPRPHPGVEVVDRSRAILVGLDVDQRGGAGGERLPQDVVEL